MAKKPEAKPEVKPEAKQEVPNPRRGGSYTVQPDGTLKKNKPGAAAKPPANPEPSADAGGDSGGN